MPLPFIFVRGLCSMNMKIRSFLAKPFASYIYKGIRKSMQTAVADQETTFKQLLKVGRITEFGKEHSLDKISGYDEFRQAVPISDYEQFKPYIEKIKQG